METEAGQDGGVWRLRVPLDQLDGQSVMDALGDLPTFFLISDSKFQRALLLWALLFLLCALIFAPLSFDIVTSCRGQIGSFGPSNLHFMVFSQAR